MGGKAISLKKGGEAVLRAAFITAMDKVFKDRFMLHRKITYTLDEYKKDGTRRLIVYLRSGPYLAFTLAAPITANDLENLAGDTLAWAMLVKPMETPRVRK